MYAAEGDYVNAAISFACGIPAVGTVVAGVAKTAKAVKAIKTAQKITDACRTIARVGNAAAGMKANYDTYMQVRREGKSVAEAMTYTAGAMAAGFAIGASAKWGAGKLKNLASKAMPKLKTAAKEAAGKLAKKIGGSITSYRTGAGKTKYKYNMIKNPGPLSRLKNNPAQNFAGGKYNKKRLKQDTVFYRAGEKGNPFGQWFTREAPESVAKVRIDTAVKPQWIDTITNEMTGHSYVDTVYAIKIPKGTTIYEGPVGYQGGVYLGGENIMQTLIPEPWKLDVEIMSEIPLN